MIWGVFLGSWPEPFFPRYSPWKTAFAVTFFILGIFMAAVFLLAWKRQQEKKKTLEIKEDLEKESEKRGKINL